MLQQVHLLERVEDDDFIEAVEELRLKDALRLLHDFVPHRLVIVNVLRCTEAHRRLSLDQISAHIRRHDDDRVAEIDLAA